MTVIITVLWWVYSAAQDYFTAISQRHYNALNVSYEYVPSETDRYFKLLVSQPNINYMSNYNIILNYLNASIK